MIEKFFPNIDVNAFGDVTPKMLIDNRISAVILDIDNTLVTYAVEEPTKEVIEWINLLKSNGINACLVSNAKKARVEKFNEKLGINYIFKAGKPKLSGFLKAAEVMHVQPYQTAVIGDQIFTDIYGGRRANMFTILVKPISEVEIWPIRVKRFFEKFIIYFYKNSKPRKLRVLNRK
jgi:HAD superfamily phosphatase (TIGR01668 family)